MDRTQDFLWSHLPNQIGAGGHTWEWKAANLVFGLPYLTLGERRTRMSRQDSNPSPTSVRTVLKQEGFSSYLRTRSYLFASYRYIVLGVGTLPPEKREVTVWKKMPLPCPLILMSQKWQVWLTSTGCLRCMCGCFPGNSICASAGYPLFLLFVTKASQSFLSSSKTALWCRDNENTNIHTGM